MKLFKNLMLLAAGTLVMASCLRQNTWNPYTGGDEFGSGEPVPVQLRTNRPVSSVDVKGHGALNNWDGNQEVFIYGIAREGKNAEATQKQELDFTGEGILIDNVKAFPNPHAVDPPSDTQPIELYNPQTDPKEFFYYDEDRRYEFFGYYVDDAATFDAETGAPKPDVGGDAITLPVTIDGSQDLMLAYAHKEDDNLKYGINVNRMYSAYSARKGIRPNLQFAHQLARFNVRVQSGDFKKGDEEAEALAAKLILAKVTVNSHNKGTLYIANRDHYNNLPFLKVDESSSVPLDVWRPKDGVLCPLDESHGFRLVEGEGADMTAPQLDAGTVMVMPGQQKYTLYIGMRQAGYSSGLVEYTSEIDFDHVVAAPGLKRDSVAVAGHQYNIDVMVYGLQGVNVLVSMAEWQSAGDFIIDRDREVEINIPNTVLNFYALDDPPIAIGATSSPDVQLEYNDQYNPAVAVVDANGNVTPKGFGTTYIFVNAPAFEDYAASTRIVTVVVLPNNNISVEAVPTMHVGETSPLDVTLDYSAPLTFTVEDESVVTIDAHGTITAKAVGTTLIKINAGAVQDVCRAAAETTVTVNVE